MTNTNQTDEQTIAQDMLQTAITNAWMMKPMIDHGDGRTHVVLPKGFELHETTNVDRLPEHIEQLVEVDDRASLVAYANRFSDERSILIADFDAITIGAQLDWHRNNTGDIAPQHCTHLCNLIMRDSLEYERWNRIEGTLRDQVEFAQFLEENVADVINPESSDLLEICRDLEAAKSASFRSGVRLENGDRSFKYEDETRVAGAITVPTEITLLIPLFFGEMPVEVKAKFRFRVTPDGLKLGVFWHRVEYQRRATFFQIATRAAEETGLPVFNGRR